MPDSFTALYYTTSFALLSEEQRVRYTQLHGCYMNEQIMFLEMHLAPGVLSNAQRLCLPNQLRWALREFLVQEERHSEMFRSLNRAVAPDLYARTDFYFICPSPLWTTLLRIAAQRVRLLPMFLWLMLLQEERSLFYSRAMLRERGILDPRFVEVYRIHLADEVQHVRWDEDLLDHIWPSTPTGLRAVNLRLLAWLVREFLSTPKRAGMRILDQLTHEFPELHKHRTRMRRELLALAHDRHYLDALYGQEITPRTCARLTDALAHAKREILHVV